MIDLEKYQKSLDQWQKEQFGEHDDDVLKCAVGMAEEVGEVCHHILKGVQKIRGGVRGINKEEVADGVADAFIYGMQLLTKLGVNAEVALETTILEVLTRSWVEDPTGKNSTSPVQGK